MFHQMTSYLDALDVRTGFPDRAGQLHALREGAAEPDFDPDRARTALRRSGATEGVEVVVFEWSENRPVIASEPPETRLPITVTQSPLM